MESEKRMELVHAIVKEVRPVLSNSRSKKLLDYGSGTGLVSLELSDLVESILLVDSSKQDLEVAENKISKKEINNAKVFYADFTKYLPKIKIDIILVSLVLLHIPDTKLILQNLFTILNTGGKLIIIDFDKNDQVNHPKIHNGFFHDELQLILSDIGFKCTDFKTFYHGNQIFAKQDASMFISTSVK